MKFRLEIDCDNDAFVDNDSVRDEEVASILYRLANQLHQVGIDNGVRLQDDNGNTVGRAYFTED